MKKKTVNLSLAHIRLYMQIYLKMPGKKVNFCIYNKTYIPLCFETNVFQEVLIEKNPISSWQ